MLAIKRKIKLMKIRRLIDKRNEEFFKGNYDKAIEYGKLVDKYFYDIFKSDNLKAEDL